LFPDFDEGKILKVNVFSKPMDKLYPQIGENSNESYQWGEGKTV